MSRDRALGRAEFNVDRIGPVDFARLFLVHIYKKTHPAQAQGSGPAADRAELSMARAGPESGSAGSRIPVGFSGIPGPEPGFVGRGSGIRLLINFE